MKKFNSPTRSFLIVVRLAKAYNPKNKLELYLEVKRIFDLRLGS